MIVLVKPKAAISNIFLCYSDLSCHPEQREGSWRGRFFMRSLALLGMTAKTEDEGGVTNYQGKFRT
jgi:hypothetical protein